MKEISGTAIPTKGALHKAPRTQRVHDFFNSQTLTVLGEVITQVEERAASGARNRHGSHHVRSHSFLKRLFFIYS
jgi:hypothetical protein